MIRCMIKGLINNDVSEQALNVYDQNILAMDNRTHSLALKACINSNKFEKGIEIIKNYKLLSHVNNNNETDVIIETQLIEFYAYFNDLQTAKHIFECIDGDKLDVICINSMMAILVTNKQNQQALQLFDTYLNKQYELNAVTYLTAIKACINMNDFEKGKQIIYCVQQSLQLEEQSMELKNTLIDFYGTFGCINEAENIFNSIGNKKDIFSIGAMMEAYYMNKYYSQCLQLFTNCKAPNIVCYCIALKACTASTAYYFGEQIYETLKNENEKHKKEMLNDVQIQINLINFYGKCGTLDICKAILKKSKHKKKDIAIWNALINAYARNGKINKIRKLYCKIKGMEKMYEIVCADRKFFISLINSCSHCGDIEFANEIWQNDIKNDNIKYDSYVITSLVDCFARKGLIENAKNMISEYEQYKNTNDITVDENDKVMYLSLLNGCKMNGNTQLAQQIYSDINSKFKKQMTEKYISSIDIILSNAYAASDKANV